MISREELENIAQLARLHISEEEIAGFQKDISSILEYMGHIGGTASDGTPIPPTHRNIFRDDTLRTESDPLAGTRDSILSALPRREGDYVVVRKILQKDEPTL